MRTKLTVARALAGTLLTTCLVSGSAQATSLPVLKGDATPRVVMLVGGHGGGGGHDGGHGGGHGHGGHGHGQATATGMRTGIIIIGTTAIDTVTVVIGAVVGMDMAWAPAGDGRRVATFGFATNTQNLKRGVGFTSRTLEEFAAEGYTHVEANCPRRPRDPSAADRLDSKKSRWGSRSTSSRDACAAPSAEVRYSGSWQTDVSGRRWS